MKKLQNNYTTPEQSKRLLELGAPADSADFYYQNVLDARIIPTDRLYKEYTDSLIGLNREIWYFKPCWSVGRLIEIVLICAEIEMPAFINFSITTRWKVMNNIDYMMSIFTNYAKILHMDFSKLEE
jgi:hypothetical protein